jgi:hypothetical protein
MARASEEFKTPSAQEINARKPRRTGRIAVGIAAAGIAAATGVGGYLATRGGDGAPRDTSLPTRVVSGGLPSMQTPEITMNPSPEVTPSATPTVKPTPESTPTPDLTFPGDLASWKNGQIHAEHMFLTGNGRGTVPLNIIGPITETSTGNYDQVQAYNPGVEIVDEYVIVYYCFKDGANNQFFLPFSYGLANEASPFIGLEAPRNSFFSSDIKTPTEITTSQAKDILQQNIRNNIIFWMGSFGNKNDINPNFPQAIRDEVFAQSPTSQKLMEWLLKTTNGSYEELLKDPNIDPDIAALVNTRLTHVDPTKIPMAFGIIPYQTTP